MVDGALPPKSTNTTKSDNEDDNAPTTTANSEATATDAVLPAYYTTHFSVASNLPISMPPCAWLSPLPLQSLIKALTHCNDMEEKNVPILGVAATTEYDAMLQRLQ